MAPTEASLFLEAPSWEGTSSRASSSKVNNRKVNSNKDSNRKANSNKKDSNSKRDRRVMLRRPSSLLSLSSLRLNRQKDRQLSKRLLKARPSRQRVRLLNKLQQKDNSKQPKARRPLKGSNKPQKLNDQQRASSKQPKRSVQQTRPPNSRSNSKRRAASLWTRAETLLTWVVTSVSRTVRMEVFLSAVRMAFKLLLALLEATDSRARNRLPLVLKLEDSV